MKEFDFIRQYLSAPHHDADVLIGIGDDAAVVRPRAGFDLCFSSDMLLQDRHFFAGDAPADVAYKVLAVNVSDMAAMGATPRWILLSAALPELNPARLDAFCRSLFAAAKQFGVTLIGGDTTRGDTAFNVTIVGELPAGQALRRSAAQAGDDIWVSGTLGAAAAALHHHWGNIQLPAPVFEACEQARLRPVPRVALGRALLPIARAAQDVSDGLAQDLGHILKASGTGADLFADAVPTLPALRDILPAHLLYDCILAGGDDYELLFTAPAESRAQVEAAARHTGTPATRIGTVNDSGRLNICDVHGRTLTPTTLGFDHFG